MSFLFESQGEILSALGGFKVSSGFTHTPGGHEDLIPGMCVTPLVTPPIANSLRPHH